MYLCKTVNLLDANNHVISPGYNRTSLILRHASGFVHTLSLYECTSPTAIPQLVVELADVRILALGTITKPRSNFSINPNAHHFLNPPGIAGGRHPNAFTSFASPAPYSLVDDHGVYPNASSSIPACCKHRDELKSFSYYIPNEFESIL